MSNPIESIVNSITKKHVAEITREVVSRIRSLPLEDLLPSVAKRAPRPRSAGAATKRINLPKELFRLPRRTPKQIAKGVEHVVGVVKKHKDGMRSEQIQQALGIDKRALPRLLKEGIKTGQLRRAGTRRATRYKVAA